MYIYLACHHSDQYQETFDLIETFVCRQHFHQQICLLQRIKNDAIRLCDINNFHEMTAQDEQIKNSLI